ncbi:radical SAM protein [Candidatus Bipolaricaulota bacterium]
MHSILQVVSLAGRVVESWLGRRWPLLGGVKLTHDCNLSCVHCPFWKRERVSLTFPQTVDALETLRRMGVRFVIFEGGEPFVWRDGDSTLADVVREARKRFVCVGVTTNGTHPIEVDSDIVWVSIDGMEETHDRIRGPTFEQILSNIDASSHPNLYAHLTINALNHREIRDLVPFLAPRVRGITVQFHYPFGGSDDPLTLPWDDRRRVLEELIELKQAGFPIADSVACLEALKENRWRCRPWLVASVDPDGSVTSGCYVKTRGRVSCANCGYAAHAELSLAFGGRPGPALAGLRIFSRHR